MDTHEGDRYLLIGVRKEIKYKPAISGQVVYLKIFFQWSHTRYRHVNVQNVN